MATKPAFKIEKIIFASRDAHKNRLSADRITTIYANTFFTISLFEEKEIANKNKVKKLPTYGINSDSFILFN